MEELSVQQVIEFSQTIEEESHNFYTEASTRLQSPELRALVDELAEAEVDHLNRLRKLLEQGTITTDDLKERVQFQTSEYKNIVATVGIREDATAKDILSSALARETATADTYKMLVSITNLNAEVVELFSYLSKQEAGHVTAIKNKLDRL